MGTTTDKLNKLVETKDAIKNALIAKGQSVSDYDTFDSYASKLGNILTPADGSIPTKTTSDLVVSGADIIVPSGYYASDVTKSVTSATQATPSINISTGGLITASSVQEAGYVSGGTKSATQQLTTKAATTITPTTIIIHK